MVTVGTDEAGVESALIAGDIACLGCGEALRPWGYGRRRTIRMRSGGVLRTPRRSRCKPCKKTHVLLPCDLFSRRKDGAEVIGAALSLSAKGTSGQEIADTLERPYETVRGWNRRVRDRAEEIRVHFTRWAVTVDATVDIAPTDSAFGDAIAAIGAAGRAAVLRRIADHPWHFASSTTSGLLLCNTNAPWRVS